MRAMVCHRLSADRSGVRVEADWAEPAPPAPGEVTVALGASALNFPDVLMLAGGYQYAPPLPFIPGVEGCGIVVAGAAGLLGRRVIVGARSGCLAERITVPLAGVRAVPAGVSDAEAAAHTVATLTAYVALVRRGRLRAGERVAVVGAGGGTGLAAVAVAKALGAHVTAIASSTAKLDAARSMGADDLVAIARGAAFALDPVDVVFDPVGGDATASLLRALRRGGRYLVVGFVGGIASVALNRLLLREIEVVGVRAGEFARRDPAGGVENLAAIDRLAAAGVRPHIGLTVPLAGAAEAFAAMAGGTLIGKAVVAIG